MEIARKLPKNPRNGDDAPKKEVRELSPSSLKNPTILQVRHKCGASPIRSVKLTTATAALGGLVYYVVGFCLFVCVSGERAVSVKSRIEN